MLSFVVAIANNNVIGKNEEMPWHLPNDLKRFKEITLSKSKTIIMGRKTFESLKKILPGRKHIVLTQNKNYKIENENVEVIYSIDDIMKYVDSNEEYFVIGGAQIFNSLFPYAKKIYLTEIYENFEGDAFFPQYDKSKWNIIERKEGMIDEKNKYKHTFLTLERA
ncbi:dihydrofolate reductase [Clostridium sp. USBA 49]|uniref:dihydrofolate reductase n=1 Tax=Clostridium sp. USBA 49 TaxID=1881060 RepID=UPI0009995999|nr:dihydrofolate reductase [Clostridium sp. USBA 49]SKA78552.1 dihydrofolate reductase [Clostridium sp. USBA 49]